MNKVSLIGYITRYPARSETQSGVSVCRFGIAVNRRSGSPDGERKADFCNVTAWRGLGEPVAGECKGGNKVAVIGNIELRTYEDREGIERTSVDVIAQDVEFLTPKGASDDGDYSAPVAHTERKKPALQSFDDDGDIPF